MIISFVNDYIQTVTNLTAILSKRFFLTAKVELLSKAKGL